MSSVSFIQSVPNILTLVRLFLVPFICILMYIDNPVTRVLSVVFAIIAAATDFLDGYIARRFNAYSRFGQCMDPISDKLLTISIMVMLIYLEKANILASLVILFREILVAGIREFVALHDGVTINVSRIAKWKTALHMIAVIILMFAAVNEYCLIFGNVALYLAAILAVLSCIDYAKSITF